MTSTRRAAATLAATAAALTAAAIPLFDHHNQHTPATTVVVRTPPAPVSTPPGWVPTPDGTPYGHPTFCIQAVHCWAVDSQGRPYGPELPPSAVGMEITPEVTSRN